jgi:phage terminase large subunit-like protein
MPIHPTTQYAFDVINGLYSVGEPELQACQRHLRDLDRQGTDSFPYIFDEKRADKVFSFFGKLKHVKGTLAGQSIELAEFQKFDLGSIFGWVQRETGYRRFKNAYIQLARKNGKTTILAGVANYLMVADGEESPEVYCAAVDKNQARLAYDIAMAMARKSLSSRLKIRDYQISHVTRGGELKPLSKETKNKDGLNPSGAIVDEYAKHPTSEIYDLLTSAEGWRAQPLISIITTAGDDVQSPCHQEYEYAKSILKQGIANERYFVMIRELDKDDDVHDPANWQKANPLRALDVESWKLLKEQHDTAFGSGIPSKIQTFKIKNLNIWVQGSESSYLTAEDLAIWDSLAVTPEEFDAITEGMVSNVGADLSKRIDLTGIGHLFALKPLPLTEKEIEENPEAEPKTRIAIRAQGFMPEDTLQMHLKTDRIPYALYEKGGWLTLTPGASVDHVTIRSYIRAYEKEHGNRTNFFAFDPYSSTRISNDLQEDGTQTVEIRQGVITLSEPMKDFRILIRERRIVHDSNPLLKMCLANVQVKTDENENIRPSKKNSGSTKRIDLFVAILNAFVLEPELREATFFADYIDGDDFGF